MTKGKVKGQVVDTNQTSSDVEHLSKEAEKDLTPEAEKDLTPEAIEELSNGKGDNEDE